MQEAFDKGSEQIEPLQPESCQGTLTDRCVPPLALASPPIVKRYASGASLARNTQYVGRFLKIRRCEQPTFDGALALSSVDAVGDTTPVSRWPSSS